MQNKPGAYAPFLLLITYYMEEKNDIKSFAFTFSAKSR